MMREVQSIKLVQFLRERLLVTVGLIGLLRETEQNYQLMFYGKKFAQKITRCNVLNNLLNVGYHNIKYFSH